MKANLLSAICAAPVSMSTKPRHGYWADLNYACSCAALRSRLSDLPQLLHLVENIGDGAHPGRELNIKQQFRRAQALYRRDVLGNLLQGTGEIGPIRYALRGGKLNV